MTTVRAALWDVGFTLVVPREPVALTYRRLAEAVAGPLPAEAFAAAFAHAHADRVTVLSAGAADGRTSEEAERRLWRRFTRLVADRLGDPALNRGYDNWHRMLVDHFDAAGAWKPALGAAEALGALRAAGVAQAAVSNWHSALEPILDGLGLRGFFAAVVTSAAAGYRKPRPEPLRLALESLGVAAAEAVHVGDSRDEDVQGALAAGLRAVWVSAEAPPEPSTGVMVVAEVGAVPGALGVALSGRR